MATLKLELELLGKKEYRFPMADFKTELLELGTASSRTLQNTLTLKR